MATFLLLTIFFVAAACTVETLIKSVRAGEARNIRHWGIVTAIEAVALILALIGLLGR